MYNGEIPIPKVGSVIFIVTTFLTQNVHSGSPWRFRKVDFRPVNPQAFRFDEIDFSPYSFRNKNFEDMETMNMKGPPNNPYFEQGFMADPNQPYKGFFDMYLNKNKKSSKHKSSTSSSEDYDLSDSDSSEKSFRPQWQQPMGFKSPETIMHEMILGDAVDMPVEMKTFMFYLKAYDCEDSSVFRRFKKRVKKLSEEEKNKKDEEKNKKDKEKNKKEEKDEEKNEKKEKDEEKNEKKEKDEEKNEDEDTENKEEKVENDDENSNDE